MGLVEVLGRVFWVLGCVLRVRHGHVPCFGPSRSTRLLGFRFRLSLFDHTAKPPRRKSQQTKAEIFPRVALNVYFPPCTPTLNSTVSWQLAYIGCGAEHHASSTDGKNSLDFVDQSSPPKYVKDAAAAGVDPSKTH